ncbi:transcriptional regulator LysR family [Janthinobacterium sp. HH01]|uniref:LysR family transcriptional regulator n=1 Tax=Janthinobacterium sp. HH01 TaxID=1198452 RepID=UPI0002AED340|nr:LysR family transcriptional regulator [Janthinobacterium sp. HH01]ELX11243.1 transcriptional regulator LysR family [Janthinobacterium sp. HH01]
MKIDILGVQAFVAIADFGGFQKAAETLHVTQTAVTQRLRNLEDFLGVMLIERTTRSIALTSIGENFLPQARRLLQELSSTLSEIRETGKAQRGDVALACVPTVGIQYLPQIIQAYSARFPDNHIKILDHASSRVAEAVQRREAEFGISLAGSMHADLVSVPLLEDHFVLVCRDDHPLAKRRSLTWTQIQPYPLIFSGDVNGNRALLDSYLGDKSADLNLQFQYDVQRSATAVGLVASGIAAAIVPRLAILKGSYPRLRIITLKEPTISRQLVLITRKAGHLSPAAQALYDMIRTGR